MLSAKVFNSKIRSAGVQNSEKWLGYFLAPSVVLTVNMAYGGAFLNLFYTDVLDLSLLWNGLFLGLLPIISKMVSGIVTILIGQRIDKTITPQGKARPWILFSGPLLTLSGILLFLVPSINVYVKIVFIIISYNLYFSLSFPMYGISHALMIPLSTRNVKERDSLALLSSTSSAIIPGTISTLLFPMLILPFVGIEQSKWLFVMSIIAVLALPGTLFEYYFTKERVTIQEDAKKETTGIVFKEQLLCCLKSKLWIIIMVIIFLHQISNTFQIISVLYYCNWVLGKYNDGITMTLVNVVGQFPMGIGIFILTPLRKKISKRVIVLGGSFLFMIGSIISLSAPRNLPIVLAGLMVRSIGSLAVYLLPALIADALDHVEQINHVRCDGFSSSVSNLLAIIGSGISMGIFNLCLSGFKYRVPVEKIIDFPQNKSIQNLFVFGFYGVPMVLFSFIFIAMLYHRDNKTTPVHQEGN